MNMTGGHRETHPFTSSSQTGLKDGRMKEEGKTPHL